MGQHQAAGGPVHVPGWAQRHRARVGASAQPWLRDGPPVVRDVVQLHEPDARAARALEGARHGQVQDGPGVLAAEGARREGGSPAPAGARRNLTTLTKEQADYIDVPVEGPFKPDTYRY